MARQMRSLTLQTEVCVCVCEVDGLMGGWMSGRWGNYRDERVCEKVWVDHWVTVKLSRGGVL